MVPSPLKGLGFPSDVRERHPGRYRMGLGDFYPGGLGTGHARSWGMPAPSRTDELEGPACHLRLSKHFSLTSLNFLGFEALHLKLHVFFARLLFPNFSISLYEWLLSTPGNGLLNSRCKLQVPLYSLSKLQCRTHEVSRLHLVVFGR